MKKTKCLGRTDRLLDDESFIARYKRSAQDFTRNRFLSFRTMAVLMLRKGDTSLQLSMNSFLPKLGKQQSTVDKSYSRTRRKLKYTAFIELNQVAVVATMYEDGDYKTWKGMRTLAIDGSKIILPKNDETIEEFGTIVYDNKRGAGEHCYGLASVLYDVLNRVTIDAQ